MHGRIRQALPLFAVVDPDEKRIEQERIILVLIEDGRRLIGVAAQDGDPFQLVPAVPKCLQQAIGPRRGRTAVDAVAGLYHSDRFRSGREFFVVDLLNIGSHSPSL